MSIKGLLRTDAEIWRASPSVDDTGEVQANYSLLGAVRCTAQSARGRTVRGPAGEVAQVELVAYFPTGTDLRPERPGQMPDRVRLEESDYVCVFVDRGFDRTSPVKVGLKGVT